MKVKLLVEFEVRELQGRDVSEEQAGAVAQQVLLEQMLAGRRLVKQEGQAYGVEVRAIREPECV